MKSENHECASPVQALAQEDHWMRMHNLLIRATLFGAAATVSRFIFRHVESRCQIAAFVLAAVFWEIVVSRRPLVVRVGRALLLSASAAIAVLAMKAYLEPVDVRVGLGVLRNDAKRDMRKVEQAKVIGGSAYDLRH